LADSKSFKFLILVLCESGVNGHSKVGLEGLGGKRTNMQ
jgi:hypothetical protein